MSWLIIILGYLLGAIPTAYLAGLLCQGIDIRQVGDDNMGAANAFRQLGAIAGITVGVLDALKGAVAVLLARAANLPDATVLAAGAAAVIGHNFTVFLGFRGGRGVSTTIGVLYALNTQAMLIMTIPTVLALVIARSTTVASAVLFISLPIVSWWLDVPFYMIVYGIALPVVVALTHYFRARPGAQHPA